MDVKLEQLGPNWSRVDLGEELSIYFSYETAVAFEKMGRRTVRENDWGPTTGRHLATLDGGGREGKKRRLPAEEFGRKLSEALSGL